MSNTKQIQKSLQSLLTDEKPFVAMISGEWGIGKTYFWNNHVEKNERVAYISLFGHNSLDDIKTAIMTEVSMIQYDKLNKFIKKANDLQIEIKGVSVSRLFSMFTKEDLQNIIICFDDFERLSNSLDLKDVLGLISYLKEEKNCKIVMILNENELDIEVESHGQSRSEIFAKKKEKIVEYSFHFMPSYNESFEIVRGDIKYFKAAWIKSFFEEIKLKNIRIMKQAISQLNHFAFIKEYELDDKVLEEFVKIALNLFVFKAKCNSNYKEYQDILAYQDTKSSAVMNQSDFIENMKYEMCIENIHRIYDFYQNHVEDIIYNFIDIMIFDKESLKSILDEKNKDIHYYTIRKDISSLVNDYLYNFKVDDNKVSKEINKIINKHSNELHHLYTYESFKNIKQRHLQNTLDENIEKTIIQNYIKDYPISGDPIYDRHANINLIKEDYTWVEQYINDLHARFEDKDISIEEVKKIMLRFITDESYTLLDSPHKLNSVSIEKYKLFIQDDSEFIELLIRFLDKRPVSSYNFKVDKAIESIKKALFELKGQSDVYARKVDYIIEQAKTTLNPRI